MRVRQGIPAHVADPSEHREDEADAHALGRLGYAQELLRRMGGFSSFAVSFSIISVLTGCITAYSDAIGPGGPAAIGIGWPVVSLGTMCVALAMAELASAFPTAGALYHWSSILGNAATGWMTAAMNIVGQIAVVAAIDFGCASELAATLGLSSSAAFWFLAIILASQALINAWSVRLVAWLNDFSATVHVLGVLVLVVVLLAYGKSQPVRFLFDTGMTTRADGNTTLGFMNGLVLSMFTFTGYDASAHLAEETHDPARRTPWGILMSVLVSAVAGYLLLVAITLAVKDLSVAGKSHAALVIMQNALGSGFGRLGMGLALVAMWFCGLSSVTSASRTLYAFSRDRGLPFHRAICKVGAKTKTPTVAIAVATTAPFLLVLSTAPFAEGAVFDAMAKMATMGLYVSYVAPVLLGALARHRGRWRTFGPFHLGGLGVVIAWLATAWGGFVLVVCGLPPNLLPAKMLGATLVVLLLLYVLVIRKHFEGPRVDLASLERERSIY